MIEDALGLQQQSLAESLGADDDELVVPVGAQEAVDLRGAVQQRLVEIVFDPDIIRVYCPRTQKSVPAKLLNGDVTIFSGRSALRSAAANERVGEL